ncbi:Hpt domain-containing protein [Citricoccus muralis]|uniref:Hpt domain-containing protein n=1 Tax=Citricoccus muralis TaxID=169134 RepID=A0A3D9LDG7_9MICC|nr:Hpt domain-containing protein [Citricoccus muralis]REE03714.1 Hpt domain-containing protein [Citricoccus muralis]
MTTAPVLDADALGRLGEQLGDTDMLCRFIHRYEAMLDQRVERLQRALTARDHEDWMDAVLSLKTSSALAGAEALSRLAAELQEDFASRPPTPVLWPAMERLTEIMECVRRLAAETARQLRLFLQQDPSPA